MATTYSLVKHISVASSIRSNFVYYLLANDTVTMEQTHQYGPFSTLDAVNAFTKLNNIPFTVDVTKSIKTNPILARPAPVVAKAIPAVAPAATTATTTPAATTTTTPVAASTPAATTPVAATTKPTKANALAALAAAKAALEAAEAAENTETA